MDAQDKIKEIKQSFRLLMNGVTAQSLRDKGLNYHLNWGASLMHLKEMAADYSPDYNLALGLWKQNVRECKIMATMLMPVEKFSHELAIQWVEQTPTQEIAEVATMNLFQHLPYAAELAKELIATDGDISRIYGYNIIARNPIDLDEDTVEKLIDVLQDASLSVRHTALNAAQRLAEKSEANKRVLKKTLSIIQMDDLIL